MSVSYVKARVMEIIKRITREKILVLDEDGERLLFKICERVSYRPASTFESLFSNTKAYNNFGDEVNFSIKYGISEHLKRRCDAKEFGVLNGEIYMKRKRSNHWISLTEAKIEGLKNELERKENIYKRNRKLINKLKKGIKNV